MLLRIKPDVSVVFNPHNISFTQTKKQLNARINAYDANDNQYWIEWQNIKNPNSIDYQHPDKVVLHKKTYLRPHETTDCYKCHQPLTDDDHNYYIDGFTHVPSQINLRRICNNCADQLIDLTSINPLLDNVTFKTWGFPFKTLPTDGNRYLLKEDLIDECQICHRLAPPDYFKNHICQACHQAQRKEESNHDQN